MSGERRSFDPEALLGEVRALAEELSPGLVERRDITLDSSLDRDLSLDSLSRVELLARIERASGVRLPPALLAHAETPRDLLRALAVADPHGEHAEFAAGTPVLGGGGAAAPDATSTLLEALLWHAGTHPARAHVHLYESGQLERTVTYGELLDGARTVAAGLVEAGLEPGAGVAIMLPTSEQYFWVFFAVQLAGGVPVPIYPPARVNQIEDHFIRHGRILSNAGVTHLVTFEAVRRVCTLLGGQVDGLRAIVTVDELTGSGGLVDAPVVGADDIAFLQYTSGSTGDPKGVVLTHRNVMASLRAMRQALRAGPDDVFVSWLPLYHDMGLIGAWMGALVVGFPLVLMSPLDFLARPERWLRAIAAHGGTLSGGPNFAYELCLKRLTEADLEGLDLSSWRLAFNGAEPVSPDTMRRFAARFGAYGLPADALTPVYGLAEATLGVAFTPAGRGPRYDVVQRDAMAGAGRAAPAEPGTVGSVTHVSCGVPIPGFEVRIVDGAGREVPERVEGAVQFAGPSTTSGYYRNATATRALVHGRWLDSGDRGYVAEGELYVTGRSKDLIIRAGRNIHPHELEAVVAEVPGVRQGCVAVFAAPGEHGVERLVVVAETRESDARARTALADAIRARVRDQADVTPDEVVLAPPQAVLKTSSGKIRRSAVRDLYAAGSLGRGRRAVWLQIARLALLGAGTRWRRAVGGAAALGYAGWVWSITVPAALAAWVAVVLSPQPPVAWRRLGAIARVLLAGAGLQVRSVGAESIGGAGPLVLVANHSSYLDGLVLAASIRRPIVFVVKGELASHAPIRLFLSRLGCRFVERFDAERGASDAAALDEVTAGGALLGVFAEGTFQRMPGLLGFHLGAFASAVRTGTAVLPVVIRGTRSVLRGDEFFPRPGRIEVRVLEPIAPGPEAGWDAAVRLRDAVRAAILARCGEPDMVDRRPLLDHAAARAPAQGEQ